MPLPRWVARFNRVALNRVMRRLATRLPALGVVEHRGRKTGTTYRTPINVFQRGGRYVVWLTYGPEADWVRNVLAAGECVITTRGRQLRLVEPRMYRDESLRDVPSFTHPILRVIKVQDFLELRPALRH